MGADKADLACVWRFWQLQWHLKQLPLRPHGVRSRVSVRALAEEEKVLTNARLFAISSDGMEGVHQPLEVLRDIY